TSGSNGLTHSEEEGSQSLQGSPQTEFAQGTKGGGANPFPASSPAWSDGSSSSLSAPQDAAPQATTRVKTLPRIRSRIPKYLTRASSLVARASAGVRSVSSTDAGVKPSRDWPEKPRDPGAQRVPLSGKFPRVDEVEYRPVTCGHRSSPSDRKKAP